MDEQSRAPDAPVAEVAPLFTPVNIILFSLAAYLVYMRLKPTQTPIPVAPTPIVHQAYTLSTLKKYNGADDPRILMAVKGMVFDVTGGRAFYGPGGPYNVFAGTDASVGLAKGVVEDKHGESIEDLTADERETLQGWVDQFLGKYLVVGELVAEDAEAVRNQRVVEKD